MKFDENIRKIIDSISSDNEKVLVIDKVENREKWKGFKCTSPDELPFLTEKFDIVIVNDLSVMSSKDLSRIGDKFIIINPFLNDTLINKSERILNETSDEKLDDEMEFLNKILGKGENLVQKKKLSYLLVEKKDLVSKPSFFFNLALIQNLKKQIAEKEKIIVSQEKDIEMLTSRVKHLEHALEESERVIDGKELERIKLHKEIKQLQYQREKEKKDLIRRYGKEIKQLQDQLNDLQLLREKERKDLLLNFTQQLEEKEKELQRIKDEFETRIKNLEKEKNHIIKEKEKELEKLLNDIKKIKSSFTFKVVSAVTKRIAKVKNWYKSR